MNMLGSLGCWSYASQPRQLPFKTRSLSSMPFKRVSCDLSLSAGSPAHFLHALDVFKRSEAWQCKRSIRFRSSGFRAVSVFFQLWVRVGVDQVLRTSTGYHKNVRCKCNCQVSFFPSWQQEPLLQKRKLRERERGKSKRKKPRGNRRTLPRAATGPNVQGTALGCRDFRTLIPESAAATAAR